MSERWGGSGETDRKRETVDGGRERETIILESHFPDEDDGFHPVGVA